MVQAGEFCVEDQIDDEEEEASGEDPDYQGIVKDTEPLYHSFMYSLVSYFFPVSIHYL